MMQPVTNPQTNFSLNSLFTGSISINKPWRAVASVVGGVALLALGAYAASLISLPALFVITLGTAGIGVGYLFFKNRIEQTPTANKNLKNEVIDKIINDLKLLLYHEIDGKRVLFGYRIENEAKERLTQRYESSANNDREAVIREIQASLASIETYTENSTIEIELLIISKIDQSLPETPTVEFQTYRKTFKGLHGDGKFSLLTIEILDDFLQNIPSGFRLIQVNRSKWNEDGTFA